MIKANIVLDSVAPNGRRLITWELTYWRAIHAEFMTHTLFSRNAGSSRARPMSHVRLGVLEHPALPIHWGKNQRGMQADQELSPEQIERAQAVITRHRIASIQAHEELEAIGVHKQIANRYLEAHDHITVVMSSTERGNWYWQRRHKDAQPDIRELARLMWEAECASVPQPVPAWGWHLPYVTEFDKEAFEIDTQVKLSVSRCAAVSYLRQNDHNPTNDLERYEKLTSGEVKHWSPFQHQAQAGGSAEASVWSGNFRGWRQLRKNYKGEHREVYNGEWE